MHPHDCAVPDRGASRKRLAWAMVIVAVYMLAEVAGGWISGSLALLADAAHMLADVAALGLSLFAMWIAGKPPTAERTYGYHRTEILAALVNGAALVAISVGIFVEAISRLRHPRPVEAGVMIGVATGGLVANLASLALLSAGRNENLNVRGAWLHVASDTLGSIEAIVAGILILAFGWTLSDPIASMLIGLLVIYSSWSLLKESTAVLMEGAPAHIDVDEVRAAMIETSGSYDVHDLHVWTITSGLVALSAHVVCDGACPREDLLTRLREGLRERFGIHHITIQIETRSFKEQHPAV